MEQNQQGGQGLNSDNVRIGDFVQSLSIIERGKREKKQGMVIHVDRETNAITLEEHEAGGRARLHYCYLGSVEPGDESSLSEEVRKELEFRRKGLKYYS